MAPSGENKSRPIMETVKTVIYAVVIAVVVRTVAFEPFNIPSGSMKPTLLIGDYLFVSKYSYGYSKFSLPFSLPLIPGRILFSEPKRGDVAVFKNPKQVNVDYIKRLVGLPGDRIQVRGGILHINGEPVQRQRIENFVDQRDRFGRKMVLNRYIETLPNGVKHPILEISDEQQVTDNTPEFVVPAGHYFAMGDNRDQSQDSRFMNDVGFVPRENLVGRAEVLFFSTDGSARFWEIWFWPRAITRRLDRFFQTVD